MAFVATANARSYSIGPVMQQRATWTAASGATSGTITFDRLTNVTSVMIPGLQILTQSISGNVVTITFTDPGADCLGCAEAHGT